MNNITAKIVIMAVGIFFIAISIFGLHKMKAKYGKVFGMPISTKMAGEWLFDLRSLVGLLGGIALVILGFLALIGVIGNN